MRYRKTLFPSLSAVLCVSLAVAGDPATPPKFDELFGVGEAQATDVFGAETALCLTHALEDFNLALSGQDPVNSKSPAFPQLLDGGTTFWEGACYRLTIFKSLTTYRIADGSLVSGFVVGPSLQLHLPSSASRSQPIARTRFVFLEKRPAT